MSANKLEAFEIVKVNRRDIQEAEYNPRKITDSAKEKLKKFLKKDGLWSPLIVNKRTMTLVSGHQRLSVMDSILRKDDYELTVSLIDVDEQTEIKGNVFMNNTSAMGEWDADALKDLKDLIPDVDFVELGFDNFDIEYLFGNVAENPLEYFGGTVETKEVKDDFQRMEELNNIKAVKQAQREQSREENKGGETPYNLNMDYLLTIVFLNNAEKTKFLRDIVKPPTEKYIKSSVLFEIAQGKYKIL